MDESRDVRSAVERLCETATDQPETVDVAAVFDIAEETGSDDRYRLARALDRVVEARPATADEAVERALALLASDADDDQRFASILLEQVAAREPERTVSAVEALADAVGSAEPFTRRHVVWALAHLSEFDPGSVAPVVPRLPPGPDRPPYFESEHVVLIARNVARADPDAVVPLVPSLFEVLANADSFVGGPGPDEPPQASDPLLWLDQFKPAVEPGIGAAELLVDLSEAVPDTVAEHVEAAADVLESVDRVTVRRDVVEALATLATERPATVRPAVPALVAQLEERDEVLQARAARALGLVYDAAPDEVATAAADSLGALEPLLRDGDPSIRVAVASLYSCVAERDPAAVAPFEDALIASLDTEDGTVVASAALALSALGTDEARAALEAVLDRDLDPTVEGTVRSALDGIEN